MLLNNNEYFEVLQKIKDRIRQAQYKAVLGVNYEQILLNWDIGNFIISKIEWGNKFIDNLARDIKLEFPNMKGYSARNLRYMRKFAEIITDFEILQTVSAKLSWSHNTILLDKAKTLEKIIWYSEQTIENAWSTDDLELQCKSDLYKRQVLAEKTTNYNRALPAPMNKIAEKTLKNPFIFDFIQERENIIEREIENEMVKNITKTLLELGKGFSFCGNQYPIIIDNEEHYMDLLFYNTKLHCYVVIELKNTKFKAEYTGKLNLYLSAVDDLIKTDADNPTIGILLCRSKGEMTAKYALKDLHKPIGIAEYQLSELVPNELADTLPSAEDIEKRVKLEFDIEEEDNKQE